jgi:hypothetical protein
MNGELCAQKVGPENTQASEMTHHSIAIPSESEDWSGDRKCSCELNVQLSSK